MVKKVRHWSTHFLSFVGRVTLIRSVLRGIQAYWAQTFILLKKLFRKVESLCREFLWVGSVGGSKKAHITWEMVGAPFSRGGLNLRLLEIWNRTAILKQLWTVENKKERL